MITATDIFIKYGDRVLMDHINVVINEKDKVGLVGRNGAGKSTLLKVIAGEITPDSGHITRPSTSTLGFLYQEMSLPKGRTVMAETLTAFEEAKSIEKRLAEINTEMVERTDYESSAYNDLLVELANLTDRFAIVGGDSVEAEAERVLKGLGFKNNDFDRKTDEFSGGWQMRIELAKMLLQCPDYLLLDEPTNHLDIESIIWLENFLQTYTGAIIIISHDKQFLDNVTKRTIEVELGNVYDYKAAYSKYIDLRKDRREKMLAAFENQQRVIADKERTISRFMAKATKTKMAQSMQKQLDKLERIEIVQEDTQAMNLRFPPAPRSGVVAVEGKKVTKKYGDLLVLKNVDIKLDRGDRVAFVGQNGQGKTTLAKILVEKLNHTKGEVVLGHNIQIGYYAQNQSEILSQNLTLLETLEEVSPPEMRTKLRAILGAFLFSGEDAEKKVSVLSGGERARLALACMLLRPFNLLVLDEPTNHLDILSKDVLKQALMHYDGSLIVVSHDREFLKGLTNRTIEFRDQQLFNHIGDVNAFLEKRKLDNMREVEMSSKQTASNGTATSEAAKPELSYEERKQLLRQVSNAEKKVDRIEKEIQKLEKQMTEPTFYEQADAHKVLEKHGSLKKDLDTAMEEWAEAQERFDEAAS